MQHRDNGQVCFFSDDGYAIYLDKFDLYSIQHKVTTHSFVLMTNHVHLLLTAKTKIGVNLPMQSPERYYVRYINQIYGKTGTLWEGRFKSTLVVSDNYFLT